MRESVKTGVEKEEVAVGGRWASLTARSVCLCVYEAEGVTAPLSQSW